MEKQMRMFCPSKGSIIKCTIIMITMTKLIMELCLHQIHLYSIKNSEAES